MTVRNERNGHRGVVEQPTPVLGIQNKNKCTAHLKHIRFRQSRDLVLED